VSGASDISICMGQGSEESKWKRETDGGIFTVAPPAPDPDWSFYPFDDGKGDFRRIR
jgi:hypothetical protein